MVVLRFSDSSEAFLVYYYPIRSLVLDTELFKKILSTTKELLESTNLDERLFKQRKSQITALEVFDAAYAQKTDNLIDELDVRSHKKLRITASLTTGNDNDELVSNIDDYELGLTAPKTCDLRILSMLSKNTSRRLQRHSAFHDDIRGIELGAVENSGLSHVEDLIKQLPENLAREIKGLFTVALHVVRLEVRANVVYHAGGNSKGTGITIKKVRNALLREAKGSTSIAVKADQCHVADIRALIKVKSEKAL
ncbi:hypothetical protein G9A89_008976 [Geosiphon pyriformis]|nr:hypothetical protein G9A89_008976 [Geosiphon pyriformis]